MGLDKPDSVARPLSLLKYENYTGKQTNSLEGRVSANNPTREKNTAKVVMGTQSPGEGAFLGDTLE